RTWPSARPGIAQALTVRSPARPVRSPECPVLPVASAAVPEASPVVPVALDVVPVVPPVVRVAPDVVPVAVAGGSVAAAGRPAAVAVVCASGGWGRSGSGRGCRRLVPRWAPSGWWKSKACCAPGSVQVLIPGRMRGYGSTEEVQRGVAGAGHADGV